MNDETLKPKKFRDVVENFNFFQYMVDVGSVEYDKEDLALLKIIKVCDGGG